MRHIYFLLFQILFGVALSEVCGQDFTAPIGIPEPSFGIQESHLDYAHSTYDFGSGPQSYKDAGSGPYTHYIDTAHPSATDEDNPYGSPDRPRLSIPLELAEGSVVEVYNQIVTNGFGITSVGGSGTAERPIFIRGIGVPRVDHELRIGYYSDAAYIVLEGISAYALSIIGRREDGNSDTHAIAVRDCEVSGDANGGGIGIGSWTDNPVYDVLIWKNNIHDNGDVDADFDQDVHGIGIGNLSHHIWVLDNLLVRNSGDGIQINTRTSWTNGWGNGHHYYIGRNVAFANKQSGFWSKQASHVIFSQNTSYGHRPSDSSTGQGMGFQYGPEYVWFLYNHIYDNTEGIAIASNSVDTAGVHSFFIGNVIHDIHGPEGSYDVMGGWGAAAIRSAGGVHLYLANNTVYNAVSILNIARDIRITASNNIFDAPSHNAGYHIYAPYDDLQLNNNLLVPNSDQIAVQIDGINYTDVNSLSPAYGGNNISAEPFYVDPEHMDFRLQNGSPAIDAGIYNSIYETYDSLYGIDIQVDFDEVNRPINNWDIGAYEHGISTPETNIYLSDVGIEIFPNPTQSNVTIRGNIAKYSIEIMDSQGVTHLSYAPDRNIRTITVNIDQLPSGVYYVILRHKSEARLEVQMLLKY